MPRSRGARVLLGLLAAVLLLLLTEVGLRLAGLGGPPPGRASRLAYQHVALPLFAPAERPDGAAVLAHADPRLPARTLLAERPEDSLRVVVVGGSAVAGLGFGPNGSFPRQLERMLEELLAGREVEVLNLGVVALSSREVRWIADDACRHLDPDVLVVCTGNNEFLELHAERFARLRGSAGGDGLGAALRDSRVLGLLRRPPPVRPMDLRAMATSSRRVPEAELISEVEVTAADRAAVARRHASNLEAIADVADETGTPLVLMTVASNLRWRGREDLPEDWWGDLAGEGPGGEEALLRARARLESGDVDLPEHERLFRLAVLGELLGDTERAADRFRVARDADPHLRRATGALNGNVRRVAARRRARLLDTEQALAELSPDGVVGFDDLYDYVHFTPAGCLRVARLLALELAGADLAPGLEPARIDSWTEREQAALAALTEDPLEVGLWLGLGFGTDRIADRDLWKHAAALDELDAALSEDPRDLRALLWRGNAAFGRVGGAADAERDYRAALEVDPDSRAARENLERLLTTRRP
jgi:tetratricopeptide (TPR) repeat protein